ncbi:MAG: protein-glutamate O-methyltransferase CheR [SAR324 cluster bacterium]|nr:protein-glutamate O-methyltransferase CheR [SAR324 cluster bacterium]
MLIKIPEAMNSTSTRGEGLSITNEEFTLMRNLIHSRFGINLAEEKRGLLLTRLNKYFQKAGFTSFNQYAEYVHRDTSGMALGLLADLISTNHTFFFRESEHFKIFRETAIPQISQILKDQGSNDLRIWCAASSTGEEAYGIMMTMMDQFGSSYASWDAGLLATDISKEVLIAAEEGIYDNENVNRVPLPLRLRFFHQVKQGLWKVNDELKSEITFRRFNLVQARFPFKKPFHIIFCRNVMIYFDQATIQKLIRQFYDWTSPGGYLFVGFSESLGRIDNPYQYVSPAVYRKSA